MRIILALTICLSVAATHAQESKYQLSDFLIYNPAIEAKINGILDRMSDGEIAGQLVVAAAGRLGKSDAHIENLITSKKVGGILLLNGEKEEFKGRVERYDSLAASVGALPLTYSADAEPSLIRYKIKNSTPVKNADKHTSREEVRETAEIICGDLDYIGINYNYAPVIDVSTQNAAIGNRSFGDNRDSIITWSSTFVEVTQNNGIVATAKHFPGHGQVVGDTHEKLVYINGEMNEVGNYKPLIDAGILSIMVAHIAIRNNPDYESELPATLNKKLITNFLKGELGFKGIVITDAMGMGGVSSIPDSGIKAIRAGIDVLLMPKDELADVQAITDEMGRDDEFRARVMESARKVIRLKICMGLIP